MPYKIDSEKMPLRLYNTASRQKEIFTPLVNKQVSLYTCGPTVYHFAHIGNFRTYIFEDLLRRTLKLFGYHVRQVMNLTDVDDKTIKGAIANNVTLDEFTLPFKQAFFLDLKTLNIEPAEHYPAATDYIGEMIRLIKVLLDKEIAYVGGDGSIYYAIKKFSRYGCLSHLNLEELQAGASERISADEYEKGHIADFVLWKKYDPTRDGKIYWESPYGPGRPGWHLECSAMAMKILGETLDIHVGGIDNMFPHHENEIAQSEACSGKEFVKHWMHSEHLLVDGKKMSKSLGNFFTLRDVLAKGFTGPEVRYMLLQTHYKTQLNFTYQGLEAVRNALQRLNSFILRLNEITEADFGMEIDELLKENFNQFVTALADDLNISAALGVVFDFVRVMNTFCDEGKIGKGEAKKILELMQKFDTVLGCLSFEKGEEEVPMELLEALQKRIKAREERDWKLSDQLRDFIYERGYVIEDTPKGTRLKKGK